MQDIPIEADEIRWEPRGDGYLFYGRGAKEWITTKLVVPVVR